MTLQARVDEALQERCDRDPAAVLARPPMLAVVEAHDRFLCEVGQQWLDVAGVESSHVAPQLEQQRATDERSGGERQSRPRKRDRQPTARPAGHRASSS